MKPKVIKTQADYQAALAYLETLMDAQPGTLQEEELELNRLHSELECYNK